MSASNTNASPGIIVALVLLTIALVAVQPELKRIWRGKPVTITPFRWPFRNLVGRQRMAVAMIVSAHFMVLSAWAFVLTAASDRWLVPALVLSCAWAVSFALAISVYASGTPRFLVPPHLRSD